MPGHDFVVLEYDCLVLESHFLVTESYFLESENEFLVSENHSLLPENDGETLLDRFLLVVHHNCLPLRRLYLDYGNLYLLSDGVHLPLN